MTKHTFSLDGIHTVTKSPRDKSWAAECGTELDGIPTEMVRRLAIHGLQQKIADAASGAQTEAEALASMQKARDAILNGDWASRQAASGVDEFTRIARIEMRKAIKASVGAKSEQWAKFTGLSDEDQIAKLDANIEKNIETIRPLVEKLIADRAKRVSVEIDI